MLHTWVIPIFAKQSQLAVRFQGCALRSQQIVIAAGMQQAMLITAMAVMNPGKSLGLKTRVTSRPEGPSSWLALKSPPNHSTMRD